MDCLHVYRAYLLIHMDCLHVYRAYLLIYMACLLVSRAYLLIYMDCLHVYRARLNRSKSKVMCYYFVQAFLCKFSTTKFLKWIKVKGCNTDKTLERTLHVVFVALAAMFITKIWSVSLVL